IGLESGFSQLNCQTIFFIPVDTPFVKKESVELLLKKHRENHSITTIGRTPSAKHSLVGFFNKDVLPVIKKIHKEEFYKVGYIHNEVKSQIISFSDDQEFFNVNTPDDYKESINLL
ncbi:MAG: hypothetical protein OIF32_06810, partial [Campylobacterales bacterium]|nr:hypothetical protein [Campylobacterales bacterium]